MGRSEGTRDSRIIVIEHELLGEPTLIGLRADKVHEVTSIPLSNTEGAPRVGLRWRADVIRCLAKREGELIVVPDLAHIFATRGGAVGTVVPFAQS
jgi:purine-binding chemotaxis protein CheW